MNEDFYFVEDQHNLRERLVIELHLILCDLNGSVRGRVSSSRKRFWTLPNLYSEVSETKILLFSYWFFMQIGWRETLDTSEP